jgi:DUF4097 and DUF4098 domain-containing protein YvlB
MKTLYRILTVSLITLLAAIVMQARQDVSRSKSFNVSKGGTIEVSTSVGDIKIAPWDKNEVYVRVEGLDEEDLSKVKMTQSGNVVRVSYRSQWDDHNSHVRFDVSVPAQFNIDINTSGGDLEVRGGITGKVDGSTSGGDIKLNEVYGGPVEVSTSGGDVVVNKMECDGNLKTSGGDIRVGKIVGSLSVHTSGGDIQIESVTKSLDAKTAGGDIRVGNTGGEAHISTSGGDINIGDVGSEASVSTSGGNITVGKVTGKVTMNTAGGDIDLKGANGRVIAKTSGGDLNLQNVVGSIEGKTSGGEIEAKLTPSGKGKTKLNSAGGDVRLYIDETAKVTIEATIRLNGWGWKKSRYVVKSEFPKETYETDEEGGEIRAVYKLNGGGELVELGTSNSNIEIHKLRQ